MNTEQFLQQARAAAKAGNRADAREILEQAVSQYPENVHAWYLLSQVVDDDDRVIDCLEKVLEIDPYNNQARQRLRLWQTASKETDEFVEEKQSSTIEAQPLETAEESVGSSTAVAVGALLLLFVLLGLAYRAGILTFGAPAIPRDQLAYEVHLPSYYTTDQRWPVFVGVHGFRGSMENCWNLWGEFVEQEGFVLVCPGLSDEDGGWYQDEGEDKLLSILGYLSRDYQVEPKAFLAGFSAGGQFVQGFTFEHPDKVYAVTVLSAGNYYEPISEAAHIPFLIIIGERDNPLSIENAKEFTKLLETNNYDYEMQILPGAGHQVTSSGKQLTIDFFRKVTGSQGDE